jgi:flagellar motor switch protein FliM
MADGRAAQGVLGLKARAAQRAFEARGMSAAKALRRALSRSADVLWDLALVTQSVEIDTLDQDGVVDALGVGDLLVVLDGPDGTVGLASMHREVLTALVEVQTIQQVTQIPVDDRPLTATDAAMAAPFLDDVLQRFAATLEDNPMRPGLEGWRFGAMLEDKRAAPHLLNAPAYHAFRAEVDLALGRRNGSVGLFLPVRDKGGHKGMDAPKTGKHEHMMQRLPITLNATLARIAMPLVEVEALRPGDLLPLVPDVIDRIEFRAGQSAVVARGRLGQMNGMRAVRLNWPPAPGGAPVAAGPGAAGLAAMAEGAQAVEKAPSLDAGEMTFDMAMAMTPAPMIQMAEDDEATEQGQGQFAADPGAFDFAPEALDDTPDGQGAEAEDIGEFGSFETMDFDNLDFDAAIGKN